MRLIRVYLGFSFSLGRLSQSDVTVAHVSCKIRVKLVRTLGDTATDTATRGRTDWIVDAPVFFRVRGREAPVEGTIVDFLQADPSELEPTRNYPTYKKQRNRPNNHYVADLQKHVYCESLLEAQVLLELEFEERLVAVLAQPFRIQLPRQGGGSTLHTPDFYILCEGGARLVVDVRPEALINDVVREQAVAMEQLAAYCALTYMLRSGYSQPARSTHRWLSAYRRYDISNSAICRQILDFVEDKRLPIADVIEGASLSVTTLPFLYCLLWRRDLRIDLTEPVTRESLVWRGRKTDERTHAP